MGWLFAADNSKLTAWYDEFALLHRGDALFVRVNIDDSRIRKHVGLGDVADSGFSVTRRRTPDNDYKMFVYPMAESASADSLPELEGHFDGVLNGSIRPTFKSDEPPSEANNDNPVTTIA